MQRSSSPYKRIIPVLLGVLIMSILSGCAGVPVNQQALLSMDGMQVAKAGTIGAEMTGKSISELVPGISDGGSVATSCSSCK